MDIASRPDPGNTRVGGPPAGQFGPRPPWLLAAVTALFVVGWLLAVYAFDPIRFVLFNPRGKTGFEVFLALGQLFGALVLWLSASDQHHFRMRWVASSLLVLGIGALGFGYLMPLFGSSPDPNVSMYGSLAVRTSATVLAAIGLVPARPPVFTRGLLLALLVGGALGTVAITWLGDDLPKLVEATDVEALLTSTTVHGFPDLTGWYLGLGLVPLAAAIGACWGALARVQGEAFGQGLAVALVLLAGAQLHGLFLPSMYSSVLTTTSLLRLGLTIVIITGGVIELRRLSVERAMLLTEEQEQVRRLEDLNILKRDFSSMVAHELGSPLAAIGNLAHIITMDTIPDERKKHAAERIMGEARILQLLVRDVQESAELEREDFAVRLQPVLLRSVFDDARGYAGVIQRDHKVSIGPTDHLVVRADPERIGQVIRNLLNNAVRHTPAGTHIELLAHPGAGSVRIEVIDDGPGIDPRDRARILEKFVRGSHAGADGHGLGLYLSQRILQAHGTEFTIESEPGRGASFSFRLQEAT